MLIKDFNSEDFIPNIGELFLRDLEIKKIEH